MGAVAFGAVLFAVFLVVVAVMVWQEARREPASGAVYVLDEAAAFVGERLPSGSLLSVDDVRGILEWGLFHKQAGGRDSSPPVIGGRDSVAFIAARASAPGGTRYDPADIAAVLDLETRYLEAIGAVGPPVDGEERS